MERFEDNEWEHQTSGYNDWETIMKWAADYFNLVSLSLWSISRPHAQYVAVAAKSLPLSSSMTNPGLPFAHRRFLLCDFNLREFAFLPSLYTVQVQLCSAFTCQPGGTRGSGHKRGPLQSSHFHCPQWYCWARQQRDRTSLSWDQASACKKQQRLPRKVIALKACTGWS